MGGHSARALLLSLAFTSLLLPTCLALHQSPRQALTLSKYKTAAPAAAEGALHLRGGAVFGLFQKPQPPAPAPKRGIMSGLSALGMGPVEIVVFIGMAIITQIARPGSFTPVGGTPTIQHVFYYGWVAALSTGLGALPLVFMGAVKDHWLGVSNAIAAGMMLSASFGLMEEGVSLDPDGSSILGFPIDHYTRVAVGFVLGMWFVVSTKSWVERHEDLKFGELKGKDLRKVFLMVAVMTLHSFTEGLGIGVAFTGREGAHLGAFISASLAMHNVPEGLAVALVLMPRGITGLRSILWAIFTSMPQPLIAVPVFMFARHFIFWRSVGLGFAAGSMIWVTCFELLADAIKELSLASTGLITTSSLIAGHLIRQWIDPRED